MTEHERVYALITPLQLYFEDHLDEWDVAANRSPIHRVPFSNLQHWAIEVGDVVYEVTRMGVADGGKARYRSVPSRIWWAEANRGRVEKRFLGYTQEQHTRLDDMGDEIWRLIMQQRYCFYSSNCQMFASIFKSVTINKQLESSEKFVEVKDLPTPFNPLISIGEKVKKVKAIARASEKMALRWLQSHHQRKEKPVVLPDRPDAAWCNALQDEWQKGDFSQQHLWEVVGKANQRRGSVWRRLPRLITTGLT